MNRLVRAEVYRVLHSNHFVIWLIAVCLIFVVMMCSTSDSIFSMNLGDVINDFGDCCSFMMLLISVFVAVVVGLGYMRKVAYYEVMAGNKISHILLSKMIADAIPIAVCGFVGAIIIPIVLSIKNGIGTATHVLERFSLLFVVLLHICVCSVWMVTAIRHIAASVIVYLRFSMIEIVLMLILTLLADEMSVVPDWMKSVQHYMVMIQLNDIFQAELTAKLVFAIFVSFLVEATFWYIVSYVGMKKKLYG